MKTALRHSKPNNARTDPASFPRAPSHAAKATIQPSDLKGYAAVSFPQALIYGITDTVLYGESRDRIDTRISVHSGQTACRFSLPGAGVAIVNAATVAEDAFPELVVWPYISAAKHAVHVMRYKSRPLSRVGLVFCDMLEAACAGLGPA